jgi:hypothetical protein
MIKHTQEKWVSLYHNFGRSFKIHMFEHCNNVNVNADIVLGLFYNTLSTAVIMQHQKNCCCCCCCCYIKGIFL